MSKSQEHRLCAAGNESAQMAESARLRALLRRVLDTYCEMTSDQFACGEDRDIRREVATALGLDPADYSL